MRMHIASIRIKNFRALKDIEIPLARSTSEPAAGGIRKGAHALSDRFRS